MKKIIIVSRCTRSWWDNKDASRCWGRFSFRGFFAGEEIGELLLLAPRGSEWLTDDYLMYVVVLSCQEGTLTGEVIKARLLDELIAQD